MKKHSHSQALALKEPQDNLIVNPKSETMFVDARSLHQRLGVQTKFTEWIKRRIEEYGFLEATDYMCLTESLTEVFPKNEKNPKGGRPEKHYYLSLDTAKELAMVERTEQGRAIRQYFIEVEKELRAKRLYGQKLNLTEIKQLVFTTKINGITMYAAKETRGLLGYSTRGSLSYWRNKFSGLIVNYNGILVASPEVIELWMLKATLLGKQQYAITLSENKPVLGKNFGQIPLNFKN